MTAHIVDGKAIAKKIILSLQEHARLVPKKLCFVQFGNEPASTSFISIKQRTATTLGIDTDIIHHTEDVSTEEAIAIITKLATHDSCHGIVLQLPLPEKLRADTQKIIAAIPARLDSDALRHDSTQIAPVARAVQEIFSYYNVSLEDKHIVVLGDGILVGHPVYVMLKKILAGTSSTLEQYTLESDAGIQAQGIMQADIIITGTGNAHSITKDMIKEGAVVIDAGTSEQIAENNMQSHKTKDAEATPESMIESATETKKIVGDCHPNCAEKASLFSTTPGGIGPITVACLFAGLWDIAEQ